jgi:octaprenyl-diphosphate synthase
VTLPLIHALRQCRAEEREKVAGILEQERLGGDDLEYVVWLIDRYRGIEYTRNRAIDLVARAKEKLASFADSAEKKALFELADYVISRRK